MRPGAHDLKRHPQHAFRFTCCGWRFVLCLLAGSALLQATAQSHHYDADSLMQRVFSYPLREDLQIEAFQSDVYLRHYLRTRRKGMMMRYIPGMFRFERGDREYFGESMSAYRFTPPGRVDKKDFAFYTTMPYVHNPRDRWLGRGNISIYSPNFFTHRFLSPLNEVNRRFYRYHFKYAYVSEGRIIANVSVSPRFWNTQLLSGNIDIDVQSGAVRLFTFRFNEGWSRMQLSGEMGKSGKESLFPKRFSLQSNAKIFGNRLEEQFDATATYKFFTPPPVDSTLRFNDRFDLTERYRLHTDTSSIRRDLTYFEENRPFPLLPEQEAVYEADRLQRSLKKSATTDTTEVRRKERLKEAGDLLFDSHLVHFGTAGQVKLPPIITPSMLEWSRSKGVALQTRLQFKFNIGRYNTLRFRPRVGYNFKQKQIYWRLPAELHVLPHLDGCLSVEAAGGDHIYNSRQADEVRMSLEKASHYDSLISRFNDYNFHYYRDNRLLMHFSLQPLMGLTLKGGIRFNVRTLINWNEVAQESGMRRTLTNLAPRIHLIWTPGQYYYREGLRRYPLHSKWPTFMLDYERSIPGIDAHTSYERIEFDAKYHLPFRALRSLYLRAGGGFYTHRGSNCFIDYDHFRNSYLPAGVEDEMSGQFQLLDRRWYNESDYYSRLSAAFEGPMLLLSRIHFLTRFIEKERIYCNLLSVRSLPLYTEWGYGISIPLLDIGAFVSIAGKNQTSVGAKLVLRLGED